MCPWTGSRPMSVTASFACCRFGKCSRKCTVTVIGRSSLTLGSYVKIYIGKNLIGEGYVLKHKSGSTFILKNKKTTIYLNASVKVNYVNMRGTEFPNNTNIKY